MTELLDQTDIAQFVRLHDELRNDVPPFIQAFRAASMSRFLKTGLPTTEQEEWRYTSVAPIGKLALQRGPIVPLRTIDAHRIRGASAELVFVNGHFVSELSTSRELGDGVVAKSLRGAWQDEPQTVEKFLGRSVDSSAHSFAALNGALLEDGAYIDVGNRCDAGTIHLLFVSAGNESAIANPRILAVTGRDARLTLIETYVSSTEAPSVVNVASEIVVGANAAVDHYRLQNEGAYHISTSAVRQVRDSSYESHVITVGGTLTRNDLSVSLLGEGSGCTLDGLYLLEGSQHVDNHTIIDHATPHATSVELYKGVLDGKSRGVFDGKIVVRRDAQKTSARQTNKNLLLSNEAIADSKPQLEIHADDVKCNHGSTIGQIDKDALFYLRSRGIGAREAANILMMAFASEVVQRIRVDEIRSRLEGFLLHRLAKHEEAA